MSNIVGYGNCNTELIIKLLNYSGYNADYINNYKKIKSNTYFSQNELSLLENADILIIQPTPNSNGQLSSKHVITTLIKPTCKIFFIVFYRNNMDKTIDINIDIDMIKRCDNLGLKLVEEFNNFTCYVPHMETFFKNNYQKYRLFHSAGHPSYYFINEIITQLSEKFSLSITNDINVFYKRCKFMGTQTIISKKIRDSKQYDFINSSQYCLIHKYEKNYYAIDELLLNKLLESLNVNKLNGNFMELMVKSSINYTYEQTNIPILLKISDIH